MQTPRTTDFALNERRPALQAAPEAAGPSPLPFHRSVPGYAQSPLLRLPKLAQRLGVAELWVKHESNRYGLPAYKALGAFWAAYRALAPRAGLPAGLPGDFERLKRGLSGQRNLTLLAATDGNHGHAVARMARLLGAQARIFVPASMRASRRSTIAAEGAELIVVAGTYDDAVREAAAQRSPDEVLIQDTAWPGYEEVPAWIVDGYSTIFGEITEQLGAVGAQAHTLVSVPIGVGSLAAAAARHYGAGNPSTKAPGERTRLLGVEPLAAACLLESVRRGELTSVPGPHDSSMAGLNCGTPSSAAWPLISAEFSAFIAIPDEAALNAMRHLAEEGVLTAESGAASVAGLLELADNDDRRAALGMNSEARVLALLTEGVAPSEAP